ncbi:MAG: hypothetical protein Q7T55_22580 [Solirubrobacteraceae bacterium]|nr:hypothetical protein [Solirubrobacteraceae bacterium]
MNVWNLPALAVGEVQVYSVLRCALLYEDVKELLERYPGFRDRTMDDTDVDIQTAIDAMAEAMIALQPPDLSQAEPMRR